MGGAWLRLLELAVGWKAWLGLGVLLTKHLAHVAATDAGHHQVAKSSPGGCLPRAVCVSSVEVDCPAD